MFYGGFRSFLVAVMMGFRCCLGVSWLFFYLVFRCFYGGF